MSNRNTTKSKSRKIARSRRAIFMRNSAFVVGILMTASLVGASYYRKTTGHLVHPTEETHEPSKQPRTHHEPLPPGVIDPGSLPPHPEK